MGKGRSDIEYFNRIGQQRPYSEFALSGRSMALSTQFGQGVDLLSSRVAGARCMVIPVLALFSIDLTGFE